MIALPLEIVGRKKSVDKTIDLEAEVVKATKSSSASRQSRVAKLKTPVEVPEVGPQKEVDQTPAAPKVQEAGSIKTRVRKKRNEKTRSKKYTQLVKGSDFSSLYDLNTAIILCQKNSLSKFDGALELHLSLGVDIKDDAQKVRASLTLPHGTGKKIKVMAFVGSDKADVCLKAGADFVGSEKTIEEILSKDRPIDFDRVVATPDFMPKLAKVAKILGPKGLMPSPKNGTVSLDPEKTVAELKKGRLEIKMDPTAPVVHLSLGRLSFTPENLAENFRAVIAAVKEARPAKANADYLVSAHLSPTMGPSVKLDLTPFK